MKPYVLDDTFTIPEEIKKLSREELDRRIAILEKKAIEEAKNIPEPTLLTSQTENIN